MFVQKIILSGVIVFFCSIVFGQKDNPDYLNTITTAVPFLLFECDQTANSIGGIGVVSSDDDISSGLLQNPSNLAGKRNSLGISFAEMQFGFYSIYKNIRSMRGYYSPGQKTSIGFNLKSIDLSKKNQTGSVANPIDFYTGLCLAYNLHHDFSIGIGAKYIYSDLIGKSGSQIHPDYKPATSLAGDFGMNYRKTLPFNDNNICRFHAGISVLNIGTKINYLKGSKSGDFLPAVLKVGIMLSYKRKFYEEKSYTINLAYQAEKLLVPTPPILKLDSVGRPIPDENGYYEIELGKNPDVGVFQGIIQSFSDAPYGTWEEKNEILHLFGLQQTVTSNKGIKYYLGCGYFHEHNTKGARRIATMGTGIQYGGVSIHAAAMLFLNLGQINGLYSRGIGLKLAYDIPLIYIKTKKKIVSSNE